MMLFICVNVVLVFIYLLWMASGARWLIQTALVVTLAAILAVLLRDDLSRLWPILMRGIEEKCPVILGHCE